MSQHEDRTNHHEPDVSAIYLPAPSFQPFLLAGGVLLLAAGLIWTTVLSALGLFVLLIAVVGWTQELRVEALREQAEADDAQ